METTATDMQNEIIEGLKSVQQASRKLVSLTTEQINQVLNRLADLTDASHPEILAANQLDLARMDPDNPKYDRLLLNDDRLKAIANDIRKVAGFKSPLNNVLEERTLENGLQLKKVSVPLGIVGVIFESRPNVTFDVFALTFKSGNACVLKGSRDAKDSNEVIVSLIKTALAELDLEDVVYLSPAEREALGYILDADDYIDAAIPRGSKGLIDFVREHSKIPVIETGAGICHTYFHASGDAAKGKAIVTNAKARRVSVCNALDTLVLDHSRLNDLPALLEDLGSKHDVEVFADQLAYDTLKDKYPSDLLHLAEEEDFGREFLSHKMSVKVVENAAEAEDHIAKYSSKHSEAIVAEDQQAINRFLQVTDAAAVYANASTAFTDGGEFGLGAEIGISTQKLHARGPMGLNELTSYKWTIQGTGQTRA